MLGFLIACVVVLICLLVKKKLEYFSSKDFPYVKMTFLNVFKSIAVSGISNRPLELYEEEKDKGEPCVGYFHTLLTPSVLVLDPALVESILIKDFSHFQDHGFEVDTKHDVLSGHLFNMKGDEWRALRNKLLPTFTTGKLKGMVSTMDSCSQTFMDEMRQDVSLRKDVNLKELFYNYTVAVIASCVFAIDPESVKDPDCQFRQLLHEIVSPTKSRLLKFSVIFGFPKIAKLLGMKIFGQSTEDFFVKLTKDALEMRKKSGVKRNDFVQLLLELKERGTVEVDVRDLEEDEKKDVQQAAESETHSNKLEITDELLSAQAFVFLFAGFENTSYLAAVTLCLLSKHKEIQKRVREEVREALKKHGGMNYTALKEMKLLSASMDEALRIYSPGTFLFRQCNRNYPLRNGVIIEKGMKIIIPTQALQKDTKYWQSPEKFDPDRFLNSDITPGTYQPFGDGPRICIAQRLVLVMVKVVMAELLVNFDLQPSSKTKEPLKFMAPQKADMEGGMWGTFEPLKE